MKNILTNEENQQLVHAIQEAEHKTSGEIRVHIARRSNHAAEEEAKLTFERLGMTQTQERNGILFYLSLEDRNLVILGDRGIHEKVGEAFWKDLHHEVIRHFKEKHFLLGLLIGIQRCGVELQRYFPINKENPDELSNEISFS
ncbi:MAG: TPM domain-containing protein [Deltaproteobacteria bacterium]|nr:TPM domain-containing protein [Deltaproteobacteria bacterium]